ncbi:restriction endonuclease [Agrobacterium sp. SHOUNA12C]|nr:restriction endonuclease [Agrobacterium sp. BETTINA12B]MCJ9759451.1 restriction endonuclease [Agrobacterium sp. SHOUNA12C]
MSSVAPWRQYQRDVADHFKQLGFSVAVEEKINGARGSHVVDVVARIEMFGVLVCWIVECKLWNRPVEKENVLTLYQIAQDVGADRAFLMSESGFQAGAVRSITNTNVTLASVEELSELSQLALAKLIIARLRKDIFTVRERLYPILWAIQVKPSDYLRGTYTVVVSLLAACMEMEMTFNRAAGNVYPVEYNADFTGTRLVTVNSEIELAKLMSTDMAEVTDSVAKVEEDYRVKVAAYHG